METPRPLPRLAPTLPFKFVGGRPSLDLLNTADWPSSGPAVDRLSSYGRVLEWAVEAGVLGTAVAARLRKQAASDPAGAERALERSRELRRLLHRSVVALVSGRGVAAALERLTPSLHEALPHLVLQPGASAAAELRAGWSGMDASLEGPLWPVVWDAVQLLLSPEAERLRVCGGKDCGWVYVDRSRNGLRRWCEMETCGTTAKNRRRGRRPRPPSSSADREDGTTV
ncbi:MAG TPA: CGNR zinc finger domain-containing protein [Myxococcaceae bacterium]|jgi:predicted RNA-binding Zn ribbon-like protein